LARFKTAIVVIAEKEHTADPKLILKRKKLLECYNLFGHHFGQASEKTIL
jgi:hypothetical protein